MKSPEEAQAVCKYLNKSLVFGTQLDIKLSKRMEIVPGRGQVFTLKCGKASYQKYSGSSKRFIPTPSPLRDLVQPSRKILFYNLPISIAVEDLRKVCIIHLL